MPTTLTPAQAAAELAALLAAPLPASLEATLAAEDRTRAVCLAGDREAAMVARDHLTKLVRHAESFRALAPGDLRRGVRFEHARLRHPDAVTPLTCVVTAVRQGVAYHRPEYRRPDGTGWLGSPEFFNLDDAPRYVRRLLP